MSKQLPSELKGKIIDKANNYEWEDNPEAVRSAYIDGATDYAELLVEAQGRIKTLESALSEISKVHGQYNKMNGDNPAANHLRNIAIEALYADNKKQNK